MMNFDPELAIIEFFGPMIRVGIEGKWVEFVARPEGKRPSRKQLLALIEEMDRERTN